MIQKKPNKIIYILQDEKFQKLLFQMIFALVVIAFVGSIYHNIVSALATRGMMPNFTFLRLAGGIDIGEYLIPFNRTNSNARALLVGLINTLSISILAIFFTTILGIIVGLCRLSKNYLIRKLATIYVEFIRNIPLIVLLLFWYRGIFMSLPNIKNALIFHYMTTGDGYRSGLFILSNRGISFALPRITYTFSLYLWILVIGIVASLLILKKRRTEHPHMITLWTFFSFLCVALVGWLLLPNSPFILEYPYIKGFNAMGGLHLSTEYVCLFSGLIIYTAAYIGEIVRAGIQSVSKGQIEAARSLGLNGFQTIRLVVFPQALRVIIPPLTSSYLGVTKNTSLGVAIGYPDLFSVTGTLINQTGRVPELMLIVMGLYLSFSLITSLIMNWYNYKTRLVGY